MISVREQWLRALRLLCAAIFVAQTLLAGLCLMGGQAHAGAVALHAQHCKATDNPGKAPHRACYHCVSPDELVSPGPLWVVDHVAVFVPVARQGMPVRARLDVGARVPTGPPRSSTLIYRLTKRIRI
ncbi:MAG: hypothetical protein D6678_06690 [Zetaproteobacteria bacterium]|nr:MAG: hypothetical protein D6678_06690 [Zetaproteobacteria bacterium]